MTGKELAAIRKRAGLSQTELAQRAGIGRHAVSYWERKARVDRKSWAIKRVGKVLALPDEPAVMGARARWAERQLEAERVALESARLLWLKSEAERAARRRVQCRAMTRKGTECRCPSEPGKRRCKFHGGLSTGARTQEERKRIAEAQRKRWAKWRDGREV